MTQENNHDDTTKTPEDPIPWPENDQMSESDTSTPESNDTNSALSESD